MTARGATEVFIPRRRDCDLAKCADVVRLYRDTKPDVVIHLATEVGGIGASQTNLRRYFFANMALALHLIEHGRLHGIRKFGQSGTSSPTRSSRRSRSAKSAWGYPEETNAR